MIGHLTSPVYIQGFVLNPAAAISSSVRKGILMNGEAGTLLNGLNRKVVSQVVVSLGRSNALAKSLNGLNREVGVVSLGRSNDG